MNHNEWKLEEKQEKKLEIIQFIYWNPKVL